MTVDHQTRLADGRQVRSSSDQCDLIAGPSKMSAQEAARRAAPDDGKARPAVSLNSFRFNHRSTLWTDCRVQKVNWLSANLGPT